jgi:hypothetical protein
MTKRYSVQAYCYAATSINLPNTESRSQGAGGEYVSLLDPSPHNKTIIFLYTQALYSTRNLYIYNYLQGMQLSKCPGVAIGLKEGRYAYLFPSLPFPLSHPFPLLYLRLFSPSSFLPFRIPLSQPLSPSFLFLLYPFSPPF